MSVDDDLFEPIGSRTSKLIVDQSLINWVQKAVTGQCNIEFWVNDRTAFETYEQIADIVESDPALIQYTQQLVAREPSQRPTNALSIVEIFRHIYDGDSNFYFCSKAANGPPVREIAIANWFAIEEQLPMLHVNGHDYFEWWTLGVLKDFAGYTGFYTFATEQNARAYYGTP